MEEEYQEQLVTWPVSDLAKARGFHKYCTECWVISEDEPDNRTSQYTGLIPDGCEFECYRPSQTQLRIWLRNAYGVEINVIPDSYGGVDGYSKVWHVRILAGDDLQSRGYEKDLSSYEEALEIGLFKSLQLIIKWTTNV